VKSAVGGAAVVSILLMGIYTWWFQSSWLLTAGYALFSLCSLASIALCYRLFGFQDDDIIRQLIEREQREHNDMIAHLRQLKQDLGSLGNDEGATQVNTLTDLLNDFHEVITNRFRGRQLSASSYLDAARRVQNQSLQNLSDMVGIGHSIVSLGRQPSAEGSAQAATQQQRLNALLTDNRKLFDALSDTAVEVANIQAIGDFQRSETLAKLNDLSTIAKQQSK